MEYEEDAIQGFGMSDIILLTCRIRSKERLAAFLQLFSNRFKRKKERTYASYQYR